jgi:leucine dehydrogenase
MSVFDSPDFDGHELVTFVHDEAAGLRAIIAIHSTVPFGTSGGGCRMWPYASDDAALRDALRLSRAMSYKLALVDMPAGGAKTVVIGDPQRDKSEALWRALGRAVERLNGRYIIAEDVGTSPADMQLIAKETKFVVGRQADTAPATAYGTYLGLRTAVRRGLGRDTLDGVRVALMGLGHVGGRLARLLARDGAKLTVCDVDAKRVASLVSELGAAAVEPAAIFDADADVFAPCALGGVLDDDTIGRLRCKVIAGAANNQLFADRHADALLERGILYAPDFVINVGGVIGASQEGMQLGSDEASRSDYDEDAAFAATRRVAELLDEVFERAAAEAISPHTAAVAMAKDKLRALAG